MCGRAHQVRRQAPSRGGPRWGSGGLRRLLEGGGAGAALMACSAHGALQDGVAPVGDELGDGPARRREHRQAACGGGEPSVECGGGAQGRPEVECGGGARRRQEVAEVAGAVGAEAEAVCAVCWHAPCLTSASR